MQKRWFIKTSPESSQIEQIQQELKISDLMSAMLLQKGLTTAAEIRSYFNPEISGLHDPFLMLNMKTAVDRLVTAIDKNEKIMVYGDYDVDGTTSVALMYSVLGEFADVAYYIPDRYDEGYGLSEKGVEHAAALGINLLITLDCGIKEVANIAYARELGLDVIVCDHHTPGEILPDAIILDPKQSDCNYPYKDLCGCGVGYKLLEGLFESKTWGREKLLPWLDLVMIAIGADIVPVTGENRAICKYGLNLMNENPRVGIEALVEVAGKSFPLTLTSVVFIIAPRINAAGRLKTGCRSVELLISENKKRAKEISEEIDNYNKERRELDSTITQEALELVTSELDFENKKSTVVYKEDWHKGVVGIVASRLIEHHYRPTIVLTESHGKITGSARTAGDFNVYEAILACEHLLERFGGHQHAAGLTLDPVNLPAFRDAFEKEVSERMTRDFEVEELVIDHEVAFSDLFLAGESIFQVPRIVKMQDQMEPFGPQNQQPVFIIKSVYAKSYRILKEAHLKVDLIDTRSGISISGIGFNMADKEHLVAEGCAFDCVFTLETNTWNDRTTLQLQVRDIRETL
jgi:single-stranded-DNA-specific exonuclease